MNDRTTDNKQINYEVRYNLIYFFVVVAGVGENWVAVVVVENQVIPKCGNARVDIDGPLFLFRKSVTTCRKFVTEIEKDEESVKKKKEYNFFF